MPIPNRHKNESKKDFISRCMGDSIMNKEYPENNQRYAICMGQTKNYLLSALQDALYDNAYGSEELVDLEAGVHIPLQKDYVDMGDEPLEEYVVDTMANKDKTNLFMYRDPYTNEVYVYDKKGVYQKNGRLLMPIANASEYQGRKVTLNKPFRTPDGPKKFSVYVKNEKGNIVKVNFGDPNMKIKKNIPERRKSFRARHNCDNPGPKWKARYWSCKAW
jgi:hypothetical protein